MPMTTKEVVAYVVGILIVGFIFGIAYGFYAGMQTALDHTLIVDREFAERFLNDEARIRNEQMLIMLEQAEKACTVPNLPAWQGYGKGSKSL